MKMIESGSIVEYECPECGFTIKDIKGQDIDCPKCDWRKIIKELIGGPGTKVDKGLGKLEIKGEITGGDLTGEVK